MRYSLNLVAEAWGKRYSLVRLLRKATEEGVDPTFINGELEWLNSIILQEEM